MTGELFEISDDMLKVVSLDGHRISIRKIALKNSYGNKKVYREVSSQSQEIS